MSAVTRYGFKWGVMEVTRMAILPGDRCILQVKTPYKELDIYVSKTGRSVRIFDGHKELAATPIGEADRPIVLKTTREGYDKLRAARPMDLAGVDAEARAQLDSGEMVVVTPLSKNGESDAPVS